MQNSCFGYFGHFWLCVPKMMVSTCGKRQCLSACRKWTSSFTSFLKYYIINNPAIWLANSTLAFNSRSGILPSILPISSIQSFDQLATKKYNCKLNLRILAKRCRFFIEEVKLNWGPCLVRFLSFSHTFFNKLPKTGSYIKTHQLFQGWSRCTWNWLEELHLNIKTANNKFDQKTQIKNVMWQKQNKRI